MKNTTKIVRGSELAELLRDWSLQAVGVSRMQQLLEDKPSEDAWDAFVRKHRETLDRSLLRLSAIPVDYHAQEIATWPHEIVLALLSRLGGVTEQLRTREAALPVLEVPDGTLTVDEFMGAVIRATLISDAIIIKMH